jgi:hypothetical protein
MARASTLRRPRARRLAPWVTSSRDGAIGRALAAERSEALLLHRQAQRMERLLTVARGTRRYAGLAGLAGLADGYAGSGRDLDDVLGTFPILAREELRHCHTDLLADRPGPCSAATTSGSSGAVTQVFKPQAATTERAAIQRRWFHSLDLPPAFDLAMVTVWAGADGRPSTSLHDRRVRHREIHIDRVLQLLADGRFVADLIVCSPSLVPTLTETGPILPRITTSFEFSRPARALFGGCPPGTPESPTEVYACGELTAPIAFRFPDCGWFHVNSDAVIVEVVDLRSGEPVEEGTAGRIVVTDLLNTAMPIIRYDIGDVGAPGGGHRCPCGRATPRLQLVARDHLLNPAARWLDTMVRRRNRPALLIELGPDQCVVASPDPAAFAPLTVEAARRGLAVRMTAEIPPVLRNLVPVTASLSIAERPPPDTTGGRV